MSSHARRARVLIATGVALLVAGLLAVIISLTSQRSAPQPPAAAASPVEVVPNGPNTPPPTASPLTTSPASGLTSSPAHTPAVRGPILATSAPVHLDIPAIGVNSVIGSLGLNPDGTIEVPPLGRDSYAGWYRYSPTPGQLGPSIILGHVDSAEYGPAVFFRLGELRQHDTISITLADRTVAVFEVERVVEYHKAQFPTLQVYGNTDHAALRLITCGGTFDPSARSYGDNVVAYASLVSSHPA
jgi:hypothetical protein